MLLDELSTKVGYYLFSFNMMDVMLKIKLKSSEYGFSLCFVGFVGYASCVKCRVIRMLLECFISRFTVSNNFEELLIEYNIEYNVNFSKLALIRDIA